MNEQPFKDVSPAYVSYQTFKSQFRGLARDGELPPKIDNSVLKNMSGSGRAQFTIALKYLGLYDAKTQEPTPLGTTLATSDEAGWKTTLASILKTKYERQLEQLRRGTEQTFKESFEGVPSSLVIPAARFLIAAAKDCGLPISSHIKEISGGRPARPRASRTTETAAPSTAHAGPTTESTGTSKSSVSGAHEILLAKFPNFDPSWDESRQKAWFDSYQRLLAITTGGEK